ncbi:MAG: hypothetical protein GX130_04765 [Candidatus Hydrogenedens sp.]|jgi:hypothetical protein|nr:hypothetical protein [Candidatus Hydrogenedens sp.]
MPLQLVNNRDVHIAQEWLVQLHRLIRESGPIGFDPFDIKAHPFLQGLQKRPLLRKTTTLLCDAFPEILRSMLQIRPSLNPKTPALFALGDLRLYELTKDTCHLDRARTYLKLLEDLARETPSGGLAWGYPFPLSGAGVALASHAPVTVVTAIAGSAFLRTAEITREERWLDTARKSMYFFLKDLPRIQCENERWCFAYALGDARRIHNANLLAVEYILRTALLTEEEDPAEELQPALQFSLEAQAEDGSWPYGARDSHEDFEPALMSLVDNHHSGFVLRSLHGIDLARPELAPELDALIRKGYRFYHQLFTPAGRPLEGQRRWPVDIHAAAEGILCPSVLSDRIRGTMNDALAIMRWTHEHMREPRSSAPWYRLYPVFSSRILYPRWSLAWMYRALAEYLYASRNNSPSLTQHYNLSRSSTV